MGKHSFKSTTVNCPICAKECQSRGLHSHLRLVHPNSDLKKELRKKIIAPLRPNEKVIFSLSLWKGYSTNPTMEAMYLIKHAGLDVSDIEFLADLFYVWAETGSLSDAIRQIEKETSKGIILNGTDLVEIDEDEDEDEEDD